MKAARIRNFEADGNLTLLCMYTSSSRNNISSFSIDQCVTCQERINLRIQERLILRCCQLANRYESEYNYVCTLLIFDSER